MGTTKRVDKHRWPVLIHYGAAEYRKELFQPVRNRYVKPDGGLWTSPLESTDGWKEWCISQDLEDYFKIEESNSFMLRLYDQTKVYVIDCLKDLENAPLLPPNRFGDKYINFETLRESYDAIWLTAQGQARTRWNRGKGLDLYGWDVETVLIMNPECCYQIEGL